MKTETSAKKIETALKAMTEAVKSSEFNVVKVCEHRHHLDGGMGLGSITVFIGHKEDDDECWGCFAESMDDVWYGTIQRIWSLLCPLVKERDRIHEISYAEALARMRMAWEIADHSLFSGGSGGMDEVLENDEKELSRRTKVLDEPIRKLLEGTSRRLKSSQDLTGKLGSVEALRSVKRVVETALNKVRHG